MRFQLFLLRWRIKAKYGLRRYTEQHFPRFWHWIAEWGWAALMIGALAFEQGEEYLAAVLLLECSAISLFAAVFHWKGISQSPHLTKAGRLVVVAVSAILGLFSPVWILASKGDKTWSRLPHGVEI